MPEEGQETGARPDEPVPARRPATGAEVTEGLRGAFTGMLGRDMERNEQILTLVGALAALLTGIGLMVAVLAEHHHPKGQLPAAAYLGISGGFAILLFLAARRGSRVVSSVVAMLGAMVAMPGVLRFPYLALAVWLLLRNSRAVREQRTAQQGASGRPAGRQRAAGGRRAGRRAQEEPATGRRPDQSKRYTPPAARRRK